MKKIALLIAFSISQIICFGQFSLTKDGLVNTKNPEVPYIVLEFEGKSQEELYNLVHIYLNKIYLSPKDVLSVLENKSISINGISKDVIQVKKRAFYDIRYTISIEFKDGRIRVNTPIILDIYKYVSLQKFTLELINRAFTPGIFFKNGDVNYEMPKKSVEDYINSYIQNISEAISSNSKEDNW